MRSQPMVIGVGNPHRGDDAVGPAVVARIRGIQTAICHDCSNLIEMWDGQDDVTVVDAMVSGAPPGTVEHFDALARSLPTKRFSSTHVFDLATAVELARTLGRLPGSLNVYGIEVADMGMGSAMSPEVEDAIASVAAAIQAGRSS